MQTMQIMQTKLDLQQQELEVKTAITTRLLLADRQRAADVLLQLRYQFSRTVDTIDIVFKR